jgi:general secretion pathway protein I
MTTMRRAFTILEVLIALAIFAYAAVMLTSGYLNVLNSYDHVKANLNSPAEDIQFARAQMLNTTSIATAMQGGQYQTAEGGNVTWSADVEPSTLGVPDLFDVTASYTVAPATGGDAVTTTESFRVLRPTWSVASDRKTLQQADQQRIQALQSQP